MLDEKAGFSKDFISKYSGDVEYERKINLFLVLNAVNEILAREFGESWTAVLLNKADLRDPKMKKISNLQIQMEKCKDLSDLEKFCVDNNLNWLNEEDLKSVRAQAAYDAGDAQS